MTHPNDIPPPTNREYYTPSAESEMTRLFDLSVEQGKQIAALTAELDAAKKRLAWYAERVLHFLEDDLGNSPTKEQLKEAVELTHFWTDEYRAFLREVLKDLTDEGNTKLTAPKDAVE